MWVFLISFFSFFCMFENFYYENWAKRHRSCDGKFFVNLAKLHTSASYLITYSNISVAMKIFYRYD